MDGGHLGAAVSPPHLTCGFFPEVSFDRRQEAITQRQAVWPSSAVARAESQS